MVYVLRDTRLAELYRRTSGAVAFIDESFRPQPIGGQAPFYSMTALIMPRSDIDQARQDVVRIAGRYYWHTTEAFALGNFSRIDEMIDYIAGHTDWVVTSLETTMAVGGENRVRQTCLAALARHVSMGGGAEAVRLLVADANTEPAVNKADEATIAALRQTGDVPRPVTLWHARMADEAVLWLADAASWSTYRAIDAGDPCWAEPIAGIQTILDAQLGWPLEMKQPQAAVAPRPSGDGPHLGPAQPSAIAGGEAVCCLPFNLAQLRAQAKRRRQAAGLAGWSQGNTPEAIERRRFARRGQDDATPGLAGG